MSDSGLYECQVSYHDDVEKKLKMPVRLIVLGKGTSINDVLGVFYIYTADVQVMRVTRWIVLPLLPKALYKLGFF